ncbi:hypothetical protein OS493_033020 [Desmophyllum pertusum]|uniref:PROP1-like PPR domain-containing protein n=1 Tax=Desmophyllum pertusum TaxID=174260 RepID=A0A9W9ZJY7_9CNID|nr:hypothetical protein OS493_033020 [Desmophyllum pertusum]
MNTETNEAREADRETDRTDDTKRPERRIEQAHYLWDTIVNSGVEPDVMLYNGLLNVYLQNNHDFNPLEVLEQMENNKVEPNTTTLLLLIEGYAQKGDVAGAFKVLEFIKAAQMPLTEQVFASLVTAYGLSGDLESARGVFDLMRESGLEPDIYSYTALLCAYGVTGDMEAIMKIIDEIASKASFKNPLLKSLLEGNLRELMLTVANRGEIVTALILAAHMSEAVASQNDPIRQEIALIKHVIVSGQSLDIIMVTIQELQKTLGAVTNVYEFALNESYGTKNPELCFVILKEMLKKNLRVRDHYFYPLMAMYANKRNSNGAQDVVNLMGEYGFEPDGLVLRFLMKSYGETADANHVESFMNLSKGLPSSRIVLKSLAQLVMSTGQLEKLETTIEYATNEGTNLLCMGDAFEDYLNQRNFDPHNGVEILKVLQKHNCVQHMGSKIWMKFKSSDQDKAKDNAKFVELLLKEGLDKILDSRAYTSVLQRFQSLKMSNEFYDFVQTMKKYQINLDEYHYKQLLMMLGYDGKAEAAQFCFEKREQLIEPTKIEYSALMQAYANCPEGGITAPIKQDRNMRRICQLFNTMSSKGFELTKRAAGAACIAHLATGQYDKAEEIRLIHGAGEPQFKVLYEFMRYYSKHGDVRKTLEVMEDMNKIRKTPAFPAFVYNNLLHAYGFHGDTESQWKVFDEMKQNNVEPNSRTYSKLMQGYLNPVE